jgi:uncharacterized membrane protein (DUF485 family)
MYMDPAIVERINRHPGFQTQLHQRTRFIRWRTLMVGGIYYLLVLLISFSPEVLGRPISLSIITLGIPIGIAVAVMAFFLTEWYVRHCRFDCLARTMRLDINN